MESSRDLFDLSPEMNHKRLSVGWVCTTAFVVSVLPSVVLFFWRRKKHPIAKRFPLQVLIIVAAVTYFVLALNARLLDIATFPCYGNIFEAIGIMISLHMTMFRFCSLVFRFYLNKAQAETYWRPRFSASGSALPDLATIGGSINSIDATPITPTQELSSQSYLVNTDSPNPAWSLDTQLTRWVWRFRWLERPLFIFPVAILTVLLVIIPHIYVLIAYPDLTTNLYIDCSNSLTEPNRINFGFTVAVYVLTQGVALFVLPKISDGIGFRKEVIFLLAWTFLVFISYAIVLFVPGMQNIDKSIFPLYQIMITPWAICLVHSMTTFPLILSYKSSSEKPSSAVDLNFSSSHAESSGSKPSKSNNLSVNTDGLERFSSETSPSRMNLIRRELATQSIYSIMQDRDLLSAFQMFLQSEFAQESLYFLIEVEEFRHIASGGVLENRASISFQPNEAFQASPGTLDFQSASSELATSMLSKSPLLIAPIGENDVARIRRLASEKVKVMLARYFLPGARLELNVPWMVLSRELRSLVEQMQAGVHLEFDSVIQGASSSGSNSDSVNEGYFNTDLFESVRRNVEYTLRTDALLRFHASTFFRNVVMSSEEE